MRRASGARVTDGCAQRSEALGAGVGPWHAGLGSAFRDDSRSSSLEGGDQLFFLFLFLFLFFLAPKLSVVLDAGAGRTVFCQS